MSTPAPAPVPAIETGESIWKRRLSTCIAQIFTARNFLLLLATALVASISYYFLVALPANNKARLDFERQKYQDGQAERKAKEEAEKDAQARRWSETLNCQVEADKAYWNYVKLNGQPVPGKDGVWTAAQSIWNEASKRKAESYNECMALADK
jgi:hypothetical protein